MAQGSGEHMLVASEKLLNVGPGFPKKSEVSIQEEVSE
jgi:hypothetical protein